MPRTFKLTWQPGKANRNGRWRKKYKGRVYYFAGGRGKTDREAYDAALAVWEKRKAHIDAQSPTPHQKQYEQAIEEWESVLAWSRKHHDDVAAEEATAKLESLQKGLSATTPKPIAKAETFAGRFDRSIRYPEWDTTLAEIALAVTSQTDFASRFQNMPGYDDYVAATQRFVEGIADFRPAGGVRTVVVPAETGFDTQDPLATEREIWRDRLEVMRCSTPLAEHTLQAHIARFLEDKRADMAAGLLTAGRVNALRLILERFQKWAGSDVPVAELGSQTLIDYRAKLLQLVEEETWARSTANEHLGTIKSFVRWLWQIEAIVTLPRVLDGKNKTLDIGTSRSPIVVFTTEEIKHQLQNASTRTALYILLMLNTGMTQKDIADLDFAEVDWDAGRITRKRSKTRSHNGVPKVDYLLWPETIKLLRQERCSHSSGRVLLNEEGLALWLEELRDDGTYRKSDNVQKAYLRLTRKLKIAKPLKSLKKTSATLIRGNRSYQGLEDLFLGHAPQKMSDQHYAQAPTGMLDEAITWLRDACGIDDIRIG